ncbi:MAG: hypothetical protein EA401_04870 [Planctomycetota bacterium]|nr:MAG: hypothetical protein EA401_04870 [Planctomycetota bacterium]
MFSLLNPLLLWGMVAVSVPILIHLLMRQRPRPRPWAAMQWLLAAAQVAQRRYRLTNLLLLLLRCLAIIALVLAVSRPSLRGVGSAGDVVFVVDITTSTGPTAQTTPLQALAARLHAADIPSRSARVITVGRDVIPRYHGDIAGAIAVLEGLENDYAAGGLDLAAQSPLLERMTSALEDSDQVILVSDFRRDTAERLQEIVDEHVHTVQRLRIGEDTGNALISDIAFDQDILPRQASRLALRVQGVAAEARLRIDGGQASTVELPEQDGEGWMHISLPALSPGKRMLHIELINQGLLADNALEFPLFVRDAIPVLSIGSRRDVVSVAADADPLRMDFRRVSAAAAGATPLPDPGGVVVLRELPPDPMPLLAWLHSGGVLWTDASVLQGDERWHSLLPSGVEHDPDQPGGRLRSAIAELNENFARTVLPEVSAWQLPAEHPARVELSAGEAALVISFPVGQGMLIAESEDLSANADFRTTGAVPEWALRTLRLRTMQVRQPALLESGTRSDVDLDLERDGNQERIAQGTVAQLQPGYWRYVNGESDAADRVGVVVTPNRQEGVLRMLPEAADWNQLDVVFSDDRGRDWGWALLLVLLLVLMTEGLFAAWAGRAYGR